MKKKKTKASFKQSRVKSDKMSDYRYDSKHHEDLAKNDTGAPENAADRAMKHMVNHKPMGIKHSDRRTS